MANVFNLRGELIGRTRDRTTAERVLRDAIAHIDALIVEAQQRASPADPIDAPWADPRTRELWRQREAVVRDLARIAEVYGVPEVMTLPVLAPKRPRLAEALAVVTDVAADRIARDLARGDRIWTDANGAIRHSGISGRRVPLTITDPREAWEAMATAGLIPHDAVEDARRRFDAATLGSVVGRAVGPSSDAGVVMVNPRGPVDPGRAGLVMFEADAPIERGDLVVLTGSGRVAPQSRLFTHPVTVADAVALAADVPGVLAAEALIAARVHPHRPRVAWQLLTPPRARGCRAGYLRALARGTPYTPWELDLFATGYVLGTMRRGDAVLWTPPLAP